MIRYLGLDDFYPEFQMKAAVLLVRLAKNHWIADRLRPRAVD